MAATRGTPLQGSRSAHDVTTAGLHASDEEAGALILHLDRNAAADDVMVMGDAGNWEARKPAIPIVSADPAAPVDGQVWVRKTVLAEGTPIGLLLALTHTLYTRELSVYDGGAVYRMELTVGV